MFSTGAVPDNVVVPRLNDRFYLDFNSNALHYNGSGVGGSNNNFYSKIEALALDPNKQYTVEVVSLYYQNVNIGADIYPILLSDIADNIRVGNTNASVIFKSTVQATDTNYQQLFKHNNPTFVLPINSKLIQQVSFQMVRSDNSEPFPLDPASNVQITLLIKSV